MRKFFRLVFVLLAVQCLCFKSEAQQADEADTEEKNGFVRKVFQMIFYPEIKYDTLYINEPWGNWAVSLDENVLQYNFYHIHDGHSSKISNNPAFYTSLGLTFRGFGGGWSVNFNNLSGKTKDKDFFLKLYCNSFGGDIRFFDVGNFNEAGIVNSASHLFGTSPESKLKGLCINAYYTFNNKKFSYPAAFTFTKIQKKSAGSPMVLMFFYHDNLWLGNDEKQYGESLNKLYEGHNDYPINDSLSNILSGWTTYYLSLGAGYAYNWVPAKNLLVHASIIPSLLLYQDRDITLDDIGFSKPDADSAFDVDLTEKEKTVPYCYYNFGLDAKTSITYSWKRSYISAYYITKFNFIDMSGVNEFQGEKIHSLYRWWNAKIIFGFRF